MLNDEIKARSFFNPNPSVQLLNLYVRLGDKEILKSITASFTPGVHVILGRNGVGKTTMLRVIAGLVKFNGEVRVFGRSIREFNRKELSRFVAYCWQNPYYGFMEATVEDEIRAILKTLGVKGDWKIVELLVPREFVERDPTSLSGGEAKRVSMASMLVADQPIWLLDEPFTYLDREGVEAVIKLIEYGRQRGKTIIISLHELHYASMFQPDTYLVINNGSVASLGLWRDITDEILKGAGLVTKGEICASLHCH
jgi:energy-coupling factor transport system ATP-binding protein